MPPTASSISTSLANQIQSLLFHRLPRKMSSLLHLLLSLLTSWRSLLVLTLLLTNLKSLPLSWHIRLITGWHRHSRTLQQNRAHLARCIASLPSSSPKPLHPIFQPASISTRAPLFEIDYNLHKSNSTYFSDLDHSRSKLVARLLSPALGQDTLTKYGFRRGMLYPILGSVHCSFLREIKPYEKYSVRSRLLGWDRKWLVISSCFVRRATKKEIEKGVGRPVGGEGDHETVFACVLNKYVVKAGRVTVPPELCLAGSGWFDVRDEVVRDVEAVLKRGKGRVGELARGEGVGSTGDVTPALGPEKVVVDAADTVQRVARRLSVGVMGSENGGVKEATHTTEKGWSWEEIDAERRRGLQFADKWLALDTDLKSQYEEDVLRGLVG